MTNKRWNQGRFAIRSYALAWRHHAGTFSRGSHGRRTARKYLGQIVAFVPCTTAPLPVITTFGTRLNSSSACTKIYSAFNMLSEQSNFVTPNSVLFEAKEFSITPLREHGCQIRHIARAL